MSVEPVAALAINHIGVTVPDIHAAIDWYGEVFGFRCIMGPRYSSPLATQRPRRYSVAGFAEPGRPICSAGIPWVSSSSSSSTRQPTDHGHRRSGRCSTAGCGICASPTPMFRPWLTTSWTVAARCWHRPMNSCPAGRGHWRQPLIPDEALVAHQGVRQKPVVRDVGRCVVGRVVAAVNIGNRRFGEQVVDQLFVPGDRGDDQ